MRNVSIFTALAVALSFAGGHTLTVVAQDAEYVGHNQCKICHNKKDEGEQWNVWKAEPHSKAFETLKGDAANKVAADLGLEKPAAESPECLRCHATAYDVETKAVPAKLKIADGVQCESCHGPSSLHVDAAKIVMFKPDQKDSVDLQGNRVLPNEALCKTCHNDESPTWKADRYTTEDGKQVGFDFKQAYEKIAHDNPKTPEDGQ